MNITGKGNDIPGMSEASEAANPSEAGDDSVCRSCGSSPVVEGYSIPLCHECRQYFTKFPIPKWIKVFSVILLAIMTFSLASFPMSLNAGIAYKRGLRAESNRKYMTAAHEYEKAVEIFPNAFIPRGKLFVAYVKNHQFDKAEEVFRSISGKSTSNESEGKIIDESNESITHLEYFYDINENLYNIINQYSEDSPEILSYKLNEYITQNPDDYWAYYYYAGALFDQEKYNDSKAAYLKAFSLNPDIYEFRLGVAAAYRQTGDFDKAIEECNAVLYENTECVDAYVSLSKIELKQHEYEAALKSATTAYSLDNSNYNAVHALALAYHFNGMSSERDALLDLLKEADPYFYVIVQDIISGKSKLFD